MKEKYKAILKRNGFVWKSEPQIQWRLREDWYLITKSNWEFCVCSWDWEAHYTTSEYGVIGYLALCWLIIVYC